MIGVDSVTWKITNNCVRNLCDTATMTWDGTTTGGGYSMQKVSCELIPWWLSNIVWVMYVWDFMENKYVASSKVLTSKLGKQWQNGVNTTYLEVPKFVIFWRFEK